MKAPHRRRLRLRRTHVALVAASPDVISDEADLIVESLETIADLLTKDAAILESKPDTIELQTNAE